MNILSVDGHAIFRRGVEATLVRNGEGTLFGEAGSLAEALQRLTSGSWDLVLLELRLPDGDGMDLLGEIRQRWPSTPVLVVSGHDDEEHALQAMRAGASGYVTKDASPADLLVAVNRVRSGGRYLSAPLAERIAFAVSAGRPSELHQRLSPRELEVLRLIGRGKQLKEIAAALSLSVKSVGTYRTRILEKMDLRTNAELVRYLVEHRMLP